MSALLILLVILGGLAAALAGITYICACLSGRTFGEELYSMMFGGEE